MTPVVVPSDAKTLFLVADDIRIETGGKLTILGLFAAGQILLHTPILPIALQSLAFCMMFTDGEGKFSSTAKFLDPSGKDIVPPITAVLVKEPTKTATQILKLVPFSIASFGEYKCIVTLDQTAFQRSFFINPAPPA